jgi:CBS domain-containing protein
MRRAGTFFRGLTAGGVVNRARLVLPQEMSLVTAAHLLLEQQLGAAPVTDTYGRCVGVLSAVDILRWNLGEGRAGLEGTPPTACVWCDWQVVDVKSTERDEVLRYMTHDPLLVTVDTHLAEIADALLDPRRRPVVVVDEELRPLGVVSSKDVLAALASADRQPEEEAPAVAPTDRRAALRRSVQPSSRV